MHYLLLILSVLSGLASMPMVAMMLLDTGREVEGLSGAAMMLAMLVWAISTGLLLWRLPADRLPAHRMAGGALLLSPFVLFGGGGWPGAGLLVLGGLGLAAWSWLKQLTRRPDRTPPG